MNNALDRALAADCSDFGSHVPSHATPGPADFAQIAALARQFLHKLSVLPAPLPLLGSASAPTWSRT
jgi:hypothetical protein